MDVLEHGGPVSAFNLDRLLYRKLNLRLQRFLLQVLRALVDGRDLGVQVERGVRRLVEALLLPTALWRSLQHH